MEVSLKIILFFVNCCVLQAAWIQRNSHISWYFLSNNKSFWTEANKTCTSMKGYLATVNDQEELDFLLESNDKTALHWIGLFQPCGDCNWTWAEDGSEATYSTLPWDKNYPKQSKKKKYVTINFETGKFRNHDVELSRRYICEVSRPCEPVCAHGLCIHKGEGTFQCDCTGTGYTGSNCETDIDECKNESLCVHGECTNTGGSYGCHCTAGYLGNRCETEINECDSDPCVNGECTDRINSYYCNCRETGYEGQNCDQDIDECQTNATECQNNGKCQNNPGDYSCDCPLGFTGQFCETDIDECDSDPCVNGKCMDAVNSYTCDCMRTGFEGQNCDQEIDECESNTHKCKNSGICQNIPGNYTCNCSSGFKGRYCEIEINECASNPCQNNATCMDKIDSFECQCTDYFIGETCAEDIDECDYHTCNNGTCIKKHGGFQCNCSAGFRGDLCENDIDECFDNDICGSGTCINSIGSFQCDCPSGFNGSNCLDVNECLQIDACSNHGNCTNTIGSFNCTCHGNYYGARCENRLKSEKKESMSRLKQAFIAGCILASVSVIVLISLVIDDRVFQYRKKKSERKKKDEETESDVPVKAETSFNRDTL